MKETRSINKFNKNQETHILLGLDSYISKKNLKQRTAIKSKKINRGVATTIVLIIFDTHGDKALNKKKH